MHYIKTQLHCCGNFIDVLPTRPGGADEGESKLLSSIITWLLILIMI